MGFGDSEVWELQVGVPGDVGQGVLDASPASRGGLAGGSGSEEPPRLGMGQGS